MEIDSIATNLGTPVHHIEEFDDIDRVPSKPQELGSRVFPVRSDVPTSYMKEALADRGTFDYFESPENDQTRISDFALWLNTLISGVGIGLIKGAVSLLVRLLWRGRNEAMSTLATNHDNSIWSPLGLYVAIALLSGITASLVTEFIAPASAGGGIPDIKAFLNGNLLPGFLAKRTLLGRLVGITLVTSCGVMAGPEGPMSHAGLILGVLIPRFFIRSHSLTDKQLYDFATVGSGMGIAAAFNAPLAGTLFALEDAASYWHTQLIARTFFGCLVAALVGTYTSAGFQCDPLSPYCVSVSGEFALSDIAQTTISFKPWEIPIFIFAGIFAGILSLAISHGVYFFSKFRIPLYKRSNWFKLADVALVFTITPLLYSVASLAANCVAFYPSVPLDSTFASSLCPPNNIVPQINPVAFLLLEDRSSAISALFSEPYDGIFSQTILTISGTLVLFTTIVTNGLALPAGLFIPMVMTGSIFGRLFGTWIHLITGATNVAPGVYAIACAAGVLAGVSRMYIWIGVVMLEASSDLNMTIPIILTVVVSNWTADLGMSFPLYEKILEEKGIFFLAPADDSEIFEKYSKKEISSIMSQPAICFKEIEKRYLVTELLRFTPFSVYPVVDEAGRLRGTTRRYQLEELLKSVPDSPVSRITVPISSTPIVVPEHFNALKCYYFFTQLGTKFIVVVDKDYLVTGVVTRRNFSNIQ